MAFGKAQACKPMNDNKVNEAKVKRVMRTSYKNSPTPSSENYVIKNPLRVFRENE